MNGKIKILNVDVIISLASPMPLQLIYMHFAYFSPSSSISHLRKVQSRWPMRLMGDEISIRDYTRRWWSPCCADRPQWIKTNRRKAECRWWRRLNLNFILIAGGTEREAAELFLRKGFPVMQGWMTLIWICFRVSSSDNRVITEIPSLAGWSRTILSAAIRATPVIP